MGREDRLDAEGLRRLVRSVNRYLGEPDEMAIVEGAGDGLSVIESRPLGVAWLLDGLWRQLGVDAALATVLGGRRFSTDVERVLFALVANRAIDPVSKLAACSHLPSRSGLTVASPGAGRAEETLPRGF